MAYRHHSVQASSRKVAENDSDQAGAAIPYAHETYSHGLLLARKRTGYCGRTGQLQEIAPFNLV